MRRRQNQGRDGGHAPNNLVGDNIANVSPNILPNYLVFLCIKMAIAKLPIAITRPIYISNTQMHENI